MSEILILSMAVDRETKDASLSMNAKDIMDVGLLLSAMGTVQSSLQAELIQMANKQAEEETAKKDNQNEVVEAEE